VISSLRRALLVLVIAVVVVSIWKSPEASASAFRDFMGNLGSFGSQVIDKLSTFLKGLGK
jgi:cell shape-determining protein MreC